MWSNYDRRCRQLGSYIKCQIEARFGEDTLSWEHFMDSSRSKHWFFDWGNTWASLGIFVGTENSGTSSRNTSGDSDKVRC